MSLGWGWIWFIPITPTRTSIGLVVPAEYFKSTGKSTEEIYRDAVASEPLISHLVRNATRENKLRATKDWSFIAQRLTGENWFLAGDACGFADPILSAGLTLAQAGGRKVAYSILELERGQFDADWIKREYERSQSAQIRSHIQFADYWYTANGRFTDLEDYCSEIARTAGLELNSKDAFRWLAAGGFASEDPGVPRASTFRVGSLKFIEQLFSGSPVDWAINRNNVFKLDLEGAERDRFAMLVDGRIKPIECYQRDGKVLPLANVYSFVFAALRKESDGVKLVDLTVSLILSQRRGFDPHVARGFVMEALEAMIAEGWVAASVNEQRPFLKFILPEEGAMIHRNRDNVMV